MLGPGYSHRRHDLRISNEIHNLHAARHVLATPHVELQISAHSDDVELARGCLAGDAGALTLFETTIVPAIIQTLVRRDLTQWRDEVLQRIRVALFTSADGRPPEITAYGGRGPLRAWVSVMAMRIAFKLAQRDGREVATENNALLDAVTASDADPELAYVKQKYRAEFRAAFFEAIASAAPEDRTLLRAHLLENVSIDDLGTTLGIHRSTAARRLVQARQLVLDRTKRLLAKNLGIATSDLDSILGLVRSQLDLSLERVL